MSGKQNKNIHVDIFRPGGWNVLVDLSIKFFKTAINPVQYLEGIIGSGWISGQEVFDNYFKVLSKCFLSLLLVLTCISNVLNLKGNVALPLNEFDTLNEYSIHSRFRILKWQFTAAELKTLIRIFVNFSRCNKLL